MNSMSGLMMIFIVIIITICVITVTHVHHLVNSAHELNIQRLQAVPCRGDEVQTGMYSGVWNLKLEMLGTQQNHL